MVVIRYILASNILYNGDNDYAYNYLKCHCFKYGGSFRFEDVEKTKVLCEVLPGIECHGPRSFLKEGIPCIKYAFFNSI